MLGKLTISNEIVNLLIQTLILVCMCTQAAVNVGKYKYLKVTWVFAKPMLVKCAGSEQSLLWVTS